MQTTIGSFQKFERTKILRLTQTTRTILSFNNITKQKIVYPEVYRKFWGNAISQFCWLPHYGATFKLDSDINYARVGEFPTSSRHHSSVSSSWIQANSAEVEFNKLLYLAFAHYRQELNLVYASFYILCESIFVIVCYFIAILNSNNFIKSKKAWVR